MGRIGPEVKVQIVKSAQGTEARNEAGGTQETERTKRTKGIKKIERRERRNQKDCSRLPNIFKIRAFLMKFSISEGREGTKRPHEEENRKYNKSKYGTIKRENRGSRRNVTKRRNRRNREKRNNSTNSETTRRNREKKRNTTTT